MIIMVTSKAGGSSERYSDLATNHDDFLNQMTTDQCLDVRGDCDVKGTFYIGGGGVSIKTGTGSPDGSVTSTQGSLYIATDGTADAILWTNTDGSTAWSAVSNE